MSPAGWGVLSNLRTGFTRSADRTPYRLAPIEATTTRLKAAVYLQVGGDVYTLIGCDIYGGMVVAASSTLVKFSTKVKLSIDSKTTAQVNDESAISFEITPAAYLFLLFAYKLGGRNHAPLYLSSAKKGLVDS